METHLESGAPRADAPRTGFAWNAGGWFGAQIGSTLWMLILGLVLLARDLPAAAACLAGFALANAVGTVLWRDRARRSAYAGIQLWLLVLAVLVAAVVVVVNVRGVSEPPGPSAPVSTYLPAWVVAFVPGLMLVFHLRERQARRRG